MSLKSPTIRRVAMRVAILLSLAGSLYANVVTEKSYSPPPRQQVIAFVTQSVEWYRTSSYQREMFNQPEDLPFIESTKAVTIQILRLSFDYARAVAALEPDVLGSSDRN